jgi:hypothetical protein
MNWTACRLRHHIRWMRVPRWTSGGLFFNESELIWIESYPLGRVERLSRTGVNQIGEKFSCEIDERMAERR